VLISTNQILGATFPGGIPGYRSHPKQAVGWSACWTIESRTVKTVTAGLFDEACEIRCRPKFLSISIVHWRFVPSCYVCSNSVSAASSGYEPEASSLAQSEVK